MSKKPSERIKATTLSKRLKVYRKILGFTPDELEGVIRHAEALESQLLKLEKTDKAAIDVIESMEAIMDSKEALESQLKACLSDRQAKDDEIEKLKETIRVALQLLPHL